MIETEPMGDDRRHVQALGANEFEIPLHRVLAAAIALLDAEGIRADDGDLLKVHRRPLELTRNFDACHDDARTWPGHAHLHLERFRGTHRVVYHVDATVEHRLAVPRLQYLRAGQR